MFMHILQKATKKKTEKNEAIQTPNKWKINKYLKKSYEDEANNKRYKY